VFSTGFRGNSCKQVWNRHLNVKAFVTKGDEPVTVRPEKILQQLQKTGADPDFVRYMISREDLDYDGVFGGEDRDLGMDASDDNM